MLNSVEVFDIPAKDLMGILRDTDYPYVSGWTADALDRCERFALFPVVGEELMGGGCFIWIYSLPNEETEGKLAVTFHLINRGSDELLGNAYKLVKDYVLHWEVDEVWLSFANHPRRAAMRRMVSKWGFEPDRTDPELLKRKNLWDH